MSAKKAPAGRPPATEAKRAQRAEQARRPAAPGGGGAPAGAAGGCACAASARARPPRRQRCRRASCGEPAGLVMSQASCAAPAFVRASSERGPVPHSLRSRAAGAAAAAAGDPQAPLARRGPCGAWPIKICPRHLGGCSGARGQTCGFRGVSARGAANLGALPPAPRQGHKCPYQAQPPGKAKAQHRAGLVPFRMLRFPAMARGSSLAPTAYHNNHRLSTSTTCGC